MKLIERMRTSAFKKKEQGAITIVETLIALSVGIAVLIIWTIQQGDRLEVDGARAAGRDIATFTRAASVWIVEAPPATPGNYGIADMQDCANPAGARFLPCAYGGNTAIRYATNDTGDPVNFANLAIEVTMPPEGPTGTIDFGVFRQGADANEDGLPDSRPDIAAIALQRAREETAPGVFGYFALQFAREDPTGLVTDPGDPAFNLAEVENLARIQAQIGADPTAPFLRVDGSNEMQSGITFVNGVQISMVDDRLDIDSPGGINFETDVNMENLTATGIDATTLETQTVTVSDELKVDVADGVTGTGFDRLDQSADIVRIDGDVVRLSQDIDINKTAIDSNSTRITSNAADTTALQSDVQRNRNRINTNSTRIGTNSTRIAALGDQTAQNIYNINTLSEVLVCSPSYTQANAAAHAGNPAYQFNRTCACNYGEADCAITRNRCAGGFAPEGPDHRSGQGTGSSIAFNYETRNSYTLQCTGNTASIYDRCHVTITETDCTNIH